jgi:hypothetical protein
MPARRIKTKVGAKKTTRLAKPKPDVFDETPPNPETMIEPDDFNPHAPVDTTKIKVQTKAGAISLKKADKLDAPDGEWLDRPKSTHEELDEVAEAHPTVQKPLKEAKDILGAGDPLHEETLDKGKIGDVTYAGQVIKDLIDGMNYLYKIALNVRGPKGLKQHDEKILRDRVKKGRELIEHI